MANSAWTKDQIISLTKMEQAKKLTRHQMAAALDKTPDQIKKKIHYLRRLLSNPKPKPTKPEFRPTGKMIHRSGRPVNYDY